MSLSERAEIMTVIYRLRADTGALFARCQEARALHIAVNLECVQNLLNEILDDCKPDAPEYSMPVKLPLKQP